MKKVFSGVIFDVYQWEQKQFDGTFKTFEKLARPDTLVAICTIGDKILVIEDRQPGREPIIGLPGGRAEKTDKTLTDGILREVKEELGMTSDKVRPWLKFNPHVKIQWAVHYFIINDLEKIKDVKINSGEIIKPFLYTFDEFLMLSDNENFREENLIRTMFKARIYPEEKEKLRKIIWNEN